MPFTPVTFIDGVTLLNKATFDALQAGVIAAERTENKAVANGYASLDATGKVPVAQLPGAAGAVPTFTYGTTPPGSPAGRDSGTLGGCDERCRLMFRYHAAGTYKWEFIGALSAWAGGSSSGVTTLVDPVGGPVLTVPRAGNTRWTQRFSPVTTAYLRPAY
jgi:hypothetical protein